MRSGTATITCDQCGLSEPMSPRDAAYATEFSRPKGWETFYSRRALDFCGRLCLAQWLLENPEDQS